MGKEAWVGGEGTRGRETLATPQTRQNAAEVTALSHSQPSGSLRMRLKIVILYSAFCEVSCAVRAGDPRTEALIGRAGFIHLAAVPPSLQLPLQPKIHSHQRKGPSTLLICTVKRAPDDIEQDCEREH